MVSENSASRRPMTLQRRRKAVTRKLRELGSIASALASTGHPYMAHIVPMRRCNLACTYCNEFDDVSDPVPIEEMERRIDELGRLGTSVITISGGEPLLHPELDRVIARIRKTGAIAGMITNGSGQLRPLGDAERAVWDKVRRLTRRSYSRFNHFQEAIANGQSNRWRCRAGARYLYICEFGLVHYCSQQRGYPGIPIAQYSRADVKREFLTEKGCAPNCTISCVHQVSYIDHWRARQTSQVTPGGAHGAGAGAGADAGLVQIR